MPRFLHPFLTPGQTSHTPGTWCYKTRTPLPPSPGGLSEDQILTMVRDAEAYAEKDRSRKELVEARNEADTLAYSVEKSLAEYKVCVCMCVYQ